MKISKKLFEGGIVTAALAAASAAAVIPQDASDAVWISRQTVSKEYRAQPEAKGLAVSAGGEQEEWDNNLLLVNVSKDSYLNVRAQAGTDSAVVGKLYRGYGAVVKEKGETWTRIVSGEIKGYVKNEYCVFGEEARAFAEKNCRLQATASEDGLRVRKKSDTDSKILTLLDKGDSLKVSKKAKEIDGWVSVRYQGKKAYVSADYVDIGYKINEAVGAEEEKREAESGSGAVRADAPVSGDELRLLAAIIECEAGGEPYAGQLAVGAVVLNRVRSGSFPDSISAVIYQSGQFTPAESGRLSRVLNSGKISKSCYRAAQEALDGSDNTGGAKYFHAGTNGDGTVIGSQIFY